MICTCSVANSFEIKLRKWQKCPKCTVWTFSLILREIISFGWFFVISVLADFSWNQFWLIFREISFGWFQKVEPWKLPFWTICNFGGFDFSGFHTWKCLDFEIMQNSELLKWDEGQALAFWNQQKLISRKIRVSGKLLNLHTEKCKLSELEILHRM